MNAEDKKTFEDIVLDRSELMVGDQFRWLVKQVEALEANYNAEVAEFNAGVAAAQEGKTEIDEPHDTRFDAWCLGMAWYKYDGLKSQVEALRAEVASKIKLHDSVVAATREAVAALGKTHQAQLAKARAKAAEADSYVIASLTEARVACETGNCEYRDEWNAQLAKAKGCAEAFETAWDLLGLAAKERILLAISGEPSIQKYASRILAELEKG